MALIVSPALLERVANLPLLSCQSPGINLLIIKQANEGPAQSLVAKSKQFPDLHAHTLSVNHRLFKLINLKGPIMEGAYFFNNWASRRRSNFPVGGVSFLQKLKRRSGSLIVPHCPRSFTLCKMQIFAIG